MIFSWQLNLWDRFVSEFSSRPHALLLCGRAGIGKLEFARLVGKAILCERRGSEPAPCGSCEACHWFDEDAHLDFRQLQPELHNTVEASGEEQVSRKSNRQGAMISVDQVRNIADFLGLTAHRQGSKVVIVNTAEDLNPNAGNALLKTLEEPSAGTTFLLVSHCPERVLATIRSRCRLVRMPAPSIEEGLAWLNAQGHQLSEAMLALQEAGGAPFRALKNLQGGYFDRRRTLLQILVRDDFDPLSEAATFASGDLAEIVNILQKWIYDLITARMSSGARYNPDFLDSLQRTATRADGLRLFRLHRSLLNAQATLNHPLNPRLVLERIFIDYKRCLRASRLSH